MFYTPVTFQEPEKKIKQNDPVITAGSCFADCMGEKFNTYKFSALTNPFGTVYNPISLHRQFTMAIEGKIKDVDKITDIHGLYVHYDFHSAFGNASREGLLIEIEKALQNVHDFLKTSSWIIITWGTAWVYELKEMEQIVANCHKQPGNKFGKRLLSQQTIEEDFKNFYNTLKKFNPSLNIILTVSPVRHIKDTLPLNMVSKSVLRLAAHEIINNHPDTYYFPSYEIMMDELRDYRYYKEDMLHPTPQAEDYIWKKFMHACMEESSISFVEKWEEIRKAMTHKPFNPDSEGHKQFLRKTMDKLAQLKDKVNVDKEMEFLKKQL